ncbi:MAG: hypothetical protein KF833_14535 [Verrucomicrobiae bacterium]|nr:hypothetical protein [Verrucomicrobiae bacterium]
MKPDRPPRPLDDLERLLLRQSFRLPPREWRDAILNDVRSFAPAPAAQPASARLKPASLLRLLRALGGSAWSAAIAAWLLVVALNHYASPSRSLDRPPMPPLAPATVADLRQQRLELMAALNAEPVFAPSQPASPRRPSAALPPTRHRRHLA